jgi:hypothetical protein
MEYQQYPQQYPSQPYPGQPPVRRKRVTFGRHIKNQWNNSRGFFKQWWRQKTEQQQQPASYYPPQTGSGISRPIKRRRKHYQNGSNIFDLRPAIEKTAWYKNRKKRENRKSKKARGTKQSGGGVGNLTRQTPRKQLNNVPTHYQYHQ